MLASLRLQALTAIVVFAAYSPAVPQSAPPVTSELFTGLNQFVAAASNESHILASSDAASRAVLAHATGRPDLVQRLDSLTERIFFYAHAGGFDPAAVMPYRTKLAAAPWRCFVHTQSPGNSVDLCERTDLPAGMHELAEIRMTPFSLIFLNARGYLSLAELDELSKLAAVPKEQQSR